MKYNARFAYENQGNSILILPTAVRSTGIKTRRIARISFIKETSPECPHSMRIDKGQASFYVWGIYRRLWSEFKAEHFEISQIRTSEAKNFPCLEFLLPGSKHRSLHTLGMVNSWIR